MNTTASDGVRQAALNEAIQRELAAGGTLVDRTQYNAIVGYGGGAVNVLLVILFGGLWLLAYPAWKRREYELAVNEGGEVYRRYLLRKGAAEWERLYG
jgi:hypothetical protein